MLAILLQTGRRGRSALDTARGLLGEFRSLRGLLTAERQARLPHARPGRAPSTRCCRPRSSCRAGTMPNSCSPGPRSPTPRATREFLRARLRDRDHEVFCCLFLDNRHRVICFDEVFRGTIDGASVHPREVVKLALSRNAAAVILAHNHPSGVAEPSQADELITGRLRDALALVDIRVLDHIVVGDGACVSFAERGLL